MASKTNYNDPTVASDPPGGKHHETQKEGKKLPTDRPSQNEHKGEHKSVSVDKVKKAER